jgi:hypothetical protein
VQLLNGIRQAALDKLISFDGINAYIRSDPLQDVSFCQILRRHGYILYLRGPD